MTPHRPWVPTPPQALIGAAFIAAGVLHFTSTAAYASIVPDYLPHARELALVSGAAEILGGVGFLIPHTRRWAGIGLVALLIAVFPANVDMALHAESGVGKALSWMRLPLQLLLMWWVWRHRGKSPATGRSRRTYP